MPDQTQRFTEFFFQRHPENFNGFPSRDMKIRQAFILCVSIIVLTTFRNYLCLLLKTLESARKF